MLLILYTTLSQAILADYKHTHAYVINEGDSNPRQQIQISDKTKDARYYISAPLVTKMVGGEVIGWNPLLNSLIDLAEDLEKLGFIYYDGGVTYIEQEEKL